MEWGYSRLLHLNLRHHDGSLELQDPDTGEVLTDRRGQRLARVAAEDERDAAMQERDSAVQERDVALAANVGYQEQIRRLQERLRELQQPPEPE